MIVIHRGTALVVILLRPKTHEIVVCFVSTLGVLAGQFINQCINRYKSSFIFIFIFISITLSQC